jgi:hypothetical protein
MPEQQFNFAGLTSGGSGGPSFAGLTRGGAPAEKADLNTIEGLSTLAHQEGLGNEAQEITNQPKTLSLLHRLGKALGSFNPAEAVATGMDTGSVLQGGKAYLSTIYNDLKSAATGIDQNPNRRTFGDILPQVSGLDITVPQNLGGFGGTKVPLSGVANFITGTAADIALDPTTYVGGRLVKSGVDAASAVGGAATRGAVKAGSKVAPQVTAKMVDYVTDGLTKAKDAAGNAFVYAYGTSKGVGNKALELQSALAQIKDKIVRENVERLIKGLNPEQREEFVEKLLSGKHAELEMREAGESAQKLLEGTALKKADQAVGERGIGLELAAAARGLDDKTPGLRPTAQADARLGTAHEMANKVGAEQIEAAQTNAAFRLEGKRRATEVAKSPDPVVQKTIDEQITRNKEFAQMGEIADPYETYFPSLAKDRVKKFFEGTAGVRVGSEGYKKQFKALLKDDELVRNPAEAFARREFEIAKDATTRQTLKELVDEVGKPLTEFANEDAARKAGYFLMKEKGGFGKPVGYFLENDKRFLDNLVNNEMTTVDKLAKATGFDAVQSLFKRSVTGLFPAFHARNYLSGLVQNYEVLGAAALRPDNVADGMRIAKSIAKPEGAKGATIAMRGREVPMETVTAPFVKRFGTSDSYVADIANATADEAFTKTTSKNPLSSKAPHFRAAQAMGAFIESQQKATAYITALRQGKTVEQALEIATKAGFDYRALTKFESKVMRRLVPFYSFTRKNAELQLRTLGEHPERISNVMKAFDNMGEHASGEEREGLPAYLRSSFAIKMGGDPETGVKQYLANFGTPVEQFADQFDVSRTPALRAISQLTPPMKLTLELAFGKDSFRQKDLKDVYDAREYKTAPQPVKDFLKIKEVEKPVFMTGPDGKAKPVPGQKRIQYVADPERLLLARSLFTARGFNTLDQMFGGDYQGAAKWLKLLTGMKPQQVDLESVAASEERDRKRQLEDMLKRHGKVAIVNRPFVPKKQ